MTAIFRGLPIRRLAGSLASFPVSRYPGRMMRHCLLGLLLTAAALCAGQYSKEDREALIGQLAESKRELVIATEGLNQQQSAWKPDSATWSVIEVMEHLARMEDFLFGILEEALEKSKPIPDDVKLPDPSEMDHGILLQMPDRSVKTKSPEQGLPKEAYQNRDEAFLAFSRKREKTMEFVRTTKLDPRRYRINSPFGPIDGHQWLLMLSAHTQRHVKQIDELKRHELFPKTE